MKDVKDMTYRELVDGVKGRWGLGKAIGCESELMERLASAVPAGPRCPQGTAQQWRLSGKKYEPTMECSFWTDERVEKFVNQFFAPFPATLKDFSVEKALEKFPEKEPQPTVYSPADPGEQFKLQQGFAPVAGAKVEEVAAEIAQYYVSEYNELGLCENAMDRSRIRAILRPYLQVSQPPRGCVNCAHPIGYHDAAPDECCTAKGCECKKYVAPVSAAPAEAPKAQEPRTTHLPSCPNYGHVLVAECNFCSVAAPQAESAGPDVPDANYVINRLTSDLAKLRAERDAAINAKDSQWERLFKEAQALRQDRAVAEAEVVRLKVALDSIDAEAIAQEIFDESPMIHGRLRCWPGTAHIATKVRMHIAKAREAALSVAAQPPKEDK